MGGRENITQVLVCRVQPASCRFKRGSAGTLSAMFQNNQTYKAATSPCLTRTIKNFFRRRKNDKDAQVVIKQRLHI